MIDPDEGRNAEVAREMAASGDWMVPQLAGMPYLDKPPALFWMDAVAIRFAGRAPWAVRLPAAVAAALTVALLVRLEPEVLGWRAGVLLLGAPLFAALSAYVIFDMPLAACVTVVWTGIAAELAGGPSAARRFAMYAAIGCGLLLKGPVMLAWALGGALGAALLDRSRAPLRWLGDGMGWIAAVLPAGLWFALATVRHPEYPHYAFLEETVERLSTGSFHRQQPWWFVPAVLAGGALPWSLATPWTARLTRTGRVAAGFVLFAAVFFTLSRSKLVTYLLPALPPLAWIAAEAWSDLRRAVRGTWCVAAFYFILAAAAVAVGFLRGGPAWPGLVPVARALAVGFGALALVSPWLASRHPVRGVWVTAGFSWVLLAIGRPVLASYGSGASGAPLANAIRRVAPTARVRYEYCYSPGTDFLLGRTSALVSTRGTETTSNYQLRYRQRLIESGRWTPLLAAPVAGAEVVVRPADDPRPAPAGRRCFFRDSRFAAWVAPSDEAR